MLKWLSVKINNYTPLMSLKYICMLLFICYIFFILNFNIAVFSVIFVILLLIRIFRIPNVGIVNDNFIAAPYTGYVKSINRRGNNIIIKIIGCNLGETILYSPSSGVITDIIQKSHKIIYNIRGINCNIIIRGKTKYIKNSIYNLSERGDIVQKAHLGLIYGETDLIISNIHYRTLLIKEGQYIKGGITKICNN